MHKMTEMTFPDDWCESLNGCIIFEGMKIGILAFIVVALLLSGCGVNRSSFSPAKNIPLKYYKKIIPFTRKYWKKPIPVFIGTPAKDSMDHYFNWGRQQLKDSLTEPDFRKVLNYVTAKINCGHTSVRLPKLIQTI